MILYLAVFAAVVLMGYYVNCNHREKLNNERKTVLPTRQRAVNITMLTGIFVILFLVSALRIGTGNDYWVYRDNFLLIAGGDTPVSYEIGFQFLVLTLQRFFGQDCFLVIFGVMAFFTNLLFVKGLYDNSDIFVFTLFLFMCNGFYYMSFSNVRYYFVIGAVFCALKFLFEKRHAAFIICILAAATFHMTVLLVIPAYYVAYYLKWNKKTIWLIPTAVAGLILGRTIIRFLIFKIYPFYQGDLRFDNFDISYVNIAKCAAILVFCLLFYKQAIKDDAKSEMLFNLNLFAFLLYSFASYVPEISRICYYMVIGQIFLIPRVIMKIEDKKKRIFFSVCIVVAYLAYFVMFLRNGSHKGINILPYLTWLFD